MRTKFLIIRLSSIGDIVLTSPVVRCLKNQFPEAEIHYITKKCHEELLQSNPYIDKIHLLGDSLKVTIRELKAENFDYIIDLHNNLRSLRIKLALKSKSFSVNKLNLRKFLLTSFKINIMPNCHIVDRYMETLSQFKVRNDGQGLDHYIKENDEMPVGGLPENFRNGYVALVLAGTYPTKKMPVEKYHTLIGSVNHHFVLLGGKEEKEMATTIMEWNTGNVLDLTGKLRINQSASMVKNAKLVITNDTGLMHIAAAYHKKTLSVWGNTIPEFGMSPYMPGEGSEILELKGLHCRPCSKLGHRKCPLKHLRCMNNLPENRIIDWVKREFNT